MMKKATVKDIEVWYDECHVDRIDYIISVISKNYDFFLDILDSSRILSLVPTDENSAVYIADFEQAFYPNDAG